MTTTTAQGWYQLTIDCHAPERLVEFWQPLLGYEVPPPPDGHARWRDWYLSLGVPAGEIEGDGTDRLVPRPGRPGLAIWFQPVPEAKAGKNRLHLDLRVSPGRSVPRAERRRDVEAAVERVRAAGGTLVRMSEDDDADAVSALCADPEGNEFCLT